MQVARFSLESRPAGVQEARDWLRAALEGWGSDTARDTAVLVLSEVVTKSVRHARGATIHIVVTWSEGLLHVRVRDESLQPPVRRLASVAGGWGLALLDQLAEHWGVDQHAEGGKTVWFVIDDAA